MLDAIVECTVSSLSCQCEVKTILKDLQWAEENIEWEKTHCSPLPFHTIAA